MQSGNKNRALSKKAKSGNQEAQSASLEGNFAPVIGDGGRMMVMQNGHWQLKEMGRIDANGSEENGPQNQNQQLPRAVGGGVPGQTPATATSPAVDRARRVRATSASSAPVTNMRSSNQHIPSWRGYIESRPNGPNGSDLASAAPASLARPYPQRSPGAPYTSNSTAATPITPPRDPAPPTTRKPPFMSSIILRNITWSELEPLVGFNVTLDLVRNFHEDLERFNQARIHWREYMGMGGMTGDEMEDMWQGMSLEEKEKFVDEGRVLREEMSLSIPV